MANRVTSEKTNLQEGLYELMSITILRQKDMNIITRIVLEKKEL